MKTENMTMAHPACGRALSLIESTPGLRREEIATRIGCSFSYVGCVLRVLRESGLVGSAPFDGGKGGTSRGWFVADRLPAAIAAWKDEKRKKHNAAKLKWSTRRRARNDSLERTPDLSGKPVQRLVKAKSKRPLPFVCRAVNSVFALGGMS